jgi:hypothetical protein
LRLQWRRRRSHCEAETPGLFLTGSRQ